MKRCVTDGEILVMERLTKLGESHSAVAERFGIATSTVNNILHARRMGIPRWGKVGRPITGGLITSGSTPSIDALDLAEVKAHMMRNPGCSTDDIAMCCHMSNKQAARLKKRAGW